MEVDVRELGGSRVTVHIRLDAGEVQGAFDRTYQELSNRGGIRGFRPGKVPRVILDRHYDPEAIRAVTYETLVQERLEEAMNANNLRPIDRVEIEVGAPPEDDELLAAKIKSGLARAEEEEEEEVEEGEAEEDAEEEKVPLVEGEPFEFYAVFTAYPRPKLPDLSDLKLRRPVAEITDEEIDEQIERLRQINAEEVEVERETIEEGDLVVADVKVVLEDEDPDEVEATEREIIIGEREYLGDIDKALVGHKVGEVIEAEFAYDENHPDENLRGQSGRIIAEIKEFRGRKLPELDDDFARSLGNFENLEELRESIRSQLDEDRQEQAHEELRAQVMRYVLERTEVDLPEEMIERAAERSYEQLLREVQQMGMSPAEFAEVAGVDEDELRNNQRARAESGLKLAMALDALAEQLGVEVTEEDLTAELQRIADQGGGDIEFVLQAAALQPNFAEEVRDRVRSRKVIDQLIASAQIEDVPAEEYNRFADEAATEAEQESEVEAAENEAVPEPAVEDAEHEDKSADAAQESEPQ